MRICWIKAPPDFPSGLPMTSMAAFPFVLDSWSNGMYAISLHGSNSEYFALLLRMFCAAPTITANIRGDVPSALVMGAKKSLKIFSAKNNNPVIPKLIGVINAAILHPNLAKIVRPRSIIIKVTEPVAEEKLPINAEYSFGFGNACFNLAFQLTSTILIHIP